MNTHTKTFDLITAVFFKDTDTRKKCLVIPSI